MKRYCLASIMALLLTACAGNPKPEPILIPTPVHCVTGNVPTEPEHVQDKLTGDSGLDLPIIAGSAVKLRAWGRALFGIVESCRASAN